MIDFDEMTEEEAEEMLDDLARKEPEVVGAIIEMTLLASPLAGPIRILREVVEAVEP